MNDRTSWGLSFTTPTHVRGHSVDLVSARAMGRPSAPLPLRNRPPVAPDAMTMAAAITCATKATCAVTTAHGDAPDAQPQMPRRPLKRRRSR